MVGRADDCAPPRCKVKDCLSRPGLCLTLDDLQPLASVSHLEIYNPCSDQMPADPAPAHPEMVTANI